MLRRSFCVVFTMLLCATAFAAEPPRHEFTRMVAHWAYYDGPDYLPFIEEAQPEVAQFGFYGAHFWSLAQTPYGKGYPAHFPIQGHKECGDYFRNMNAELHKRGVKAIGHMNVKFLVGDPGSAEKPIGGFFDFYQNQWDENVLGPKPVENPADFLERKFDGTPIINQSYKIGGMDEYWACLLNPNWRKVLKAWVKNGIDAGLDGFIANYFYRHDCHCEHCVKGFKSYMADRFSAEELKEKFQIADLANQTFDEIVCWHKPAESTPLRREMLRFSQISNKKAFDEVFIEYGRSLKPDLMVAQWDHLSYFSQIGGDERCLLPAELWGKGEDYLWYSTGAAAYYTDLQNGFLGEGTLQARYIRGAFDDKPFTLGKYENTRTRAAIAELAANGGAPMGFYARFTNPEARRVIAQYYQFIKKYDDVFRACRPHAEVALLYPRSHVHNGDIEAVDKFKAIGEKLLNDHVLFDVIPDDIAAKDQLIQYFAVIDPTKPEADAAVTLLLKTDVFEKELSQFEAPQTVRVSANIPKAGGGWSLHFVNYNREEPEKPKSAGGGTQDEKPIAVSGIKVDFELPADAKVAAVQFFTPEEPEAVELPYSQKYEKGESTGGRLQFAVPEFLVYSVVRVVPVK